MENEKIVALLDSMVVETAAWGLYQVLKRAGFPVRSCDGICEVNWSDTSYSNRMRFKASVMVGRDDDKPDGIFYVVGVADPKGIIVCRALDAEEKDIYFSPFKPRL